MILTDQVVIEDRKGERPESADISNATFHVDMWSVEGPRLSVRLRLVNRIALFHGMMTDI